MSESSTASPPPPSRPEADGDLGTPRHLVLDMDGTIYLGPNLFEGTPRLFETCRRHGVGFTLVTNNSSRSRQLYLEHVHELGLAVEPSQIYTSGDATIDYLKAHGHSGAGVYLLGTPSLAEQFAGEGFALVDGESEPDLVVVAFDPHLPYERLCKAGWWIRHGKPFFATHPDVFCPTDQPTLLVDCGALTAALELATGGRAMVLGKPSAAMVEGVLRRHGLQPHEVAVVGDRLNTDLGMARNAGCTAVLVLTGVTRREDLCGSSIQPDLVMEDIGAFEAWLRRRLEGVPS